MEELVFFEGKLQGRSPQRFKLLYFQKRRKTVQGLKNLLRGLKGDGKIRRKVKKIIQLYLAIVQFGGNNNLSLLRAEDALAS